MWGTDTTTTGSGYGQYPYIDNPYTIGYDVVTGAGNDTPSPYPWWSHSSSDGLKKKPFSLVEFLAKKKRITEAWHICFKENLIALWRRGGKTQLVIANAIYRRTVEFIVRTWLSVDWRWVFKRWVQELYDTA